MADLTDLLGQLNREKVGYVIVGGNAGNCRVLGLDALIKAKEAMGRPHDRQSVAQLKAIRARAK